MGLSLEEVLDALTRESDLYEKMPGNEVRCLACAHRCRIKEKGRGVCKVRFNQAGKLMVPWGYVSALQADPIEKKPFCHFLPGATALTFGMLGCDFHCDYCQNWFTSQVLRDPQSNDALRLIRKLSPGQIIESAKRVNAEVIVSSYNEPLITIEWAVSVFKEALSSGIKCAFVSNGNATPQALEYLKPYISAYKVDLKSMQAKNYRQLGGVLENVLSTIKIAHKMGIWVEVVTLVIPGFNDTNEELFEMAQFIRSVSKDIPWHVTAYHQDYRMTEHPNTPADSLVRAADIGREAGLNFVYAGNLPGRVEEYENTNCPECSKLLIQRRGYKLMAYNLSVTGNCKYCGAKIPGIWLEKTDKSDNFTEIAPKY